MSPTSVGPCALDLGRQRGALECGGCDIAAGRLGVVGPGDERVLLRFVDGVQDHVATGIANQEKDACDERSGDRSRDGQDHPMPKQVAATRIRREFGMAVGALGSAIQVGSAALRTVTFISSRP